MSRAARALAIVDKWIESLDKYQDKLPSKGTVAAALHVLNRLKESFDLDIGAHVAQGESQIMGLSAASVTKVLTQFGESRVLSAVGGRSNRGARGDIAKLLEALQPLGLERTSGQERETVLTAMQRHIVEVHVQKFFAVKRVKAVFDPAAATSRFIDAILDSARMSGKGGAVAEYLVGAKLALRFPQLSIRNKRFSTSDAQTGHSGDFEIGSTTFHVTMAPLPELFAKIKTNLQLGQRVYLLVRRQKTAGAEQNAELLAEGRVAVESIESFVATNIDELSGFDGTELRSGLRRLLETYNQRVDQIEPDKSMLIDLPENL